MPSRYAVALAVSLSTIAPALVHAGPPLVCWPMSIGDAPSLPWGRGWHDARPDYDRRRLAADTVALLGPATPVLVRMETLRRAAVYATADDQAAGRLFEALHARMTASGGARAQALALFDLGYGAEAYRQAFVALRHTTPQQGTGVEIDENGDALVHDALARLRPDPEAEYAAALVTLSRPAGIGDGSRQLAQKHARMASAGAGRDPQLARTLAAHAPLWGGAVPAPPAVAAR